MVKTFGNYQVHSGVLSVDAHDVSFFQATWAVYESALDDGEAGRLVDGGTLPSHYPDAESAMAAAQAHADDVGEALRDRSAAAEP